MRKVMISKGQHGMVYEADAYRKPFREGYYGEAFAVLDAYIDSTVNSMIRALFGSTKEQTLLNLIEDTKEAMGDYFTGYQKIMILKKMGIISKELASAATGFKSTRNKILHNPEGEYQLVFSQDQYWEKFETQEKVDQEVQNQLNQTLNNAEKAYHDLNKILSIIATNPDQFYENWNQEKIRKAMAKAQERKKHIAKEV